MLTGASVKRAKGINRQDAKDAKVLLGVVKPLGVLGFLAVNAFRELACFGRRVILLDFKFHSYIHREFDKR